MAETGNVVPINPATESIIDRARRQFAELGYAFTPSDDED